VACSNLLVWNGALNLKARRRTVTVCTVIGEGFNKLEPVRRFINSIATLMGNAKNVEDSLRTVSHSTKALDAPPKQLPAPNDEDIPP
jgi:hypothetical protein